MDNFPDEAIDGIIAAFPGHRRGTRPIHAPGITATGHFEASPVAHQYSAAVHFAAGSRVPVTMRFSNGTGYPCEPDWVPVVRGMAMRFHLDRIKGKSGEPVTHSGPPTTDMLCMGMEVFFIKTVDRFLDLTRAAAPHKRHRRTPCRYILDALQLRSPVRKMKAGDQEMKEFGNAYPPARLSVIMANNPFVPESYANCCYRPVHAFVLTTKDGERRSARFTWEPVAGVRSAPPPTKGDGRPKDFLRQELRDRLAGGPAEFVLRMQLAELGDDTSDPTKEWTKAVRKRIVMGHLWVDAIAPNQKEWEKEFFNPTALTPGIEPSDDEVLLVRGGVYSHSRDRRIAEGGPVVLDFADCPAASP